MGSNEIKKVTDVFLEEQEWIPGYKAPFLIWGLGVGSLVAVAGVSWWIYQHNKIRTRV